MWRRIWRSLSITFLLAVLASAITTFGFAQDKGGNDAQSPQTGEQPEHRWGRGHFDPAQRTEMLTKQLKLTSDQQSKVLDILKSEQSQMEKLHSDSSLSQEDRRAKMMDIRKASNDQIRALLDPGQQKKWDKMQAEHEQWQEHRHDGQNPPPPDSSEQK